MLFKKSINYDLLCTDFDIINALHNCYSDSELKTWALDLYGRTFILLKQDKLLPLAAKEEILLKIKNQFKLIQLDIDISVSIHTTKYLKSLQGK